jgi:hypothetical protein
VWDEVFEFDLSSHGAASKCAIKLVVFDEDVANDECLGQAVIPLSDLDVMHPAEVTKRIALDQRGCVVLDIMFLAPHVMSGVQRGENMPPPVEDDRVLRVQLKSALNLLNADTMSESDPYVVFHIVNDVGETDEASRQQSNVVDDNCNPTWNQWFEFTVHRNASECSLRLEVWDEDVSRDELLGQALVPLSNVDLYDGRTSSKKVKLDTQGQVLLDLQFKVDQASVRLNDAVQKLRLNFAAASGQTSAPTPPKASKAAARNLRGDLHGLPVKVAIAAVEPANIIDGAARVTIAAIPPQLVPAMGNVVAVEVAPAHQKDLSGAHIDREAPCPVTTDSSTPAHLRDSVFFQEIQGDALYAQLNSPLATSNTVLTTSATAAADPPPSKASLSMVKVVGAAMAASASDYTRPSSSVLQGNPLYARLFTNLSQPLPVSSVSAESSDQSTTVDSLADKLIHNSKVRWEEGRGQSAVAASSSSLASSPTSTAASVFDDTMHISASDSTSTHGVFPTSVAAVSTVSSSSTTSATTRSTSSTTSSPVLTPSTRALFDSRPFAASALDSPVYLSSSSPSTPATTASPSINAHGGTATRTPSTVTPYDSTSATTSSLVSGGSASAYLEMLRSHAHSSISTPDHLPVPTFSVTPAPAAVSTAAAAAAVTPLTSSPNGISLLDRISTSTASTSPSTSAASPLPSSSTGLSLLDRIRASAASTVASPSTSSRAAMSTATGTVISTAAGETSAGVTKDAAGSASHQYQQQVSAEAPDVDPHFLQTLSGIKAMALRSARTRTSDPTTSTTATTTVSAEAGPTVFAFPGLTSPTSTAPTNVTDASAPGSRASGPSAVAVTASSSPASPLTMSQRVREAVLQVNRNGSSAGTSSGLSSTSTHPPR